MASKIFGAIDTSGGTDGALDSLLEATLSDGDLAIVGDTNEEIYFYRYEASNDNDTNPLSDPEVITPADNRDPGDTGAWILLDISVQDIKVYGNAVIDGTLTQTGLLTATAGISIGDGASITLDNAPASDHNASGIISAFTAGENVAFGDFCYLKSDGKYWKADADATATMPISAMAVATILADASGNFLKVGYARDDTWDWTVGGILYADTTGGDVTQTVPSGSGDQVQSVGIATHADRIWFFPNFQLVEIS